MEPSQLRHLFWRWWTLGLCHFRRILHNTANVYTIPYWKKCMPYHLLPKVAERIRLKPKICLKSKRVRTKSNIQTFEEILTARPSKHSSFFWYRDNTRFIHTPQDCPRRRPTCLFLLETFIEKKRLRSSLSAQNIQHMTGSMTCPEFRNRSTEVANL
jgi:hypothetical protein